MPTTVWIARAARSRLMFVYSSSVPKVRAFAVSIVLVMLASIVWLLTGLSGAASVPPPLTVHNMPYNSLIASNL